MTTTKPLTVREAISLLEHRDRCPRTKVVTTTEVGRLATLCRTCGTRVWHDERPGPQPLARPLRPSSYACRAHLLPVTWKGTGCPECEAEAEARRAAREKARADELAERNAP